VTFVINVLNATSTSLFGDGVNFNKGANNGQILWNIPGSGTITIDTGGQFMGSILAPDASIDNTNDSVINGQILSDNFNYAGAELHYTQFYCPVPEPRYTGMVIVGGTLGLALFFRLRRRKAAAI